MSLKKCIKATENLSDADTSQVLEAFDSYSGSMDQKEAAELAINDVLASVSQERQEYMDLIYEAYPNIKLEEEHKPLIPLPNDPAFSYSVVEGPGGPRTKVAIDRGQINVNAENFGFPEDINVLEDNHPLLDDTQGKYTIKGTQHKELPGGMADYSEDRKKLHEDILTKELSKAEPVPKNKKPVAILMGGGGAAGKGTILTALKSAGQIPSDGVVLVDPDEIKISLPEYSEILNTKDARAASVVHEESSDLGSILTNRAKKQRKNIVIDKTLGNPKKALALIAELKRSGYEVRLVGVTLPVEEALTRALERYYETGRLPRVRDMVSAHVAFNKNFPMYSKEVDQSALFDNEKATPILVAQGSSGKLSITDNIRYANAISRGELSGKEKTIKQLQAVRVPDEVFREGDDRGETQASSERAKESQRAYEKTRLDAQPKVAIRRDKRLDLRGGSDVIESGDFISYDDIMPDKPPKKGLTAESLGGLTKNIQRDYHGTREIVFHIRATQDQAFGPGSAKRDGVIKGGFYSGTNEVVLIAENIKNLDEAMQVIRHEVVGHFGFRKMLNAEGEYDALLDRVYEVRTEELKDLYAWVEKAYPDLIAKGDARKIADEMIARAAETKTKSNILTYVYDQIIKLLNKFGFTLDTISSSELNSLIRLSEKNLKKEIIADVSAYNHLIHGNVNGEVSHRVEPGQTNTAAFQIKSATGNAGTFDPSDPNILFSKAADNANNAPTDGELGLPEEKLKEKTARLLYDSFSRVKKLQEVIKEKGGVVEPKGDVYRAEERSSSKISYGLRMLGKNYMDPMLELMKEKNIDIDTLDSFLIAKHAQERNEYIASINDDMQDGGSGVTNQEAKDILSNLRDQREALEEIAEFVYAANNKSLDTLVEGGHLKQDVVDGWRARWNYYIPLKGKEGEEQGAGTGTGFSITGSTIKKAMGRGAGNIAESPTAHSFAQAETAIVRTEKTKVGRALVELVRANPDPEFWSISQRTFKQFETLFGEPFEGYEEAPDGLIEKLDYHRVSAITTEERVLAAAEGRKPVAKIVYKLDPNYSRRDDIFSVMVKGEELLIQIKDKVLMEQLKKMNTTQLNAVVRGFGQVNRYLAMINTALNPEFVITNFERDFQTAMINLGGEHSPAIAARVMKGIPGAVRGIWQSTFDTKGTSEWRALFDEMEKEGGTIGFFGLEDIETKVQNIQRKLTDNHGVLGRTKQGILAVRDVVLDANLSVENAARLSSYKVIKEEAIANGMSEADAKAEAASVAKNLTVNFNRKGELAPVLNSAYLFYNASIQGSMRIITALKSKNVRKIVGGVMATSFALAMYNRGAGDDDDGIPYWDKISDYTKQTNIIVMHPDGSGNYSKIKLPYGYNVFFYAGIAMNDLMFNDRVSTAKTAMNILSTTMNAFNPIQGADLLDTLTPTFLKPYEQDARNINFMGAKLKPEFPFDTYDRPESQKHFKSTNPQLKEMMAAINEATGGDETHSGIIDLSPEIVKHYVSWLTGGAGMFGTRTIGTISDLATGEEIDMKNVPFLRTLGGKPGSHYDADRFYSAIKEVAATEAQLKLLKGTDEYGDYKAEKSELHKLAIHVKRYKNKIKRLREQRDKAYLDDDKELANEKREEIRQSMMEFTMKYEDAIEAQKW